MLAAFEVGRGDPSVDSVAKCRWVPYIPILADQVGRVTVLELSTGLRPVPILAAAVFLGTVIFLAAAATVRRATGAGAPSVILKRSRQKVADWLNSHTNHIFSVHE
jgi:hypothetical protein